jgi:hypothetical protein
MRHKSSSPKCDKIFSRISSGRSFIDIGSLAITDGSENMGAMLMLSAPEHIQVQKY